MISFRNDIENLYKVKLIVHKNQDGVKRNINPLTHGSKVHTDIMKTEALKQALNKHKFDVAFGGARRDEEKSRSKERIFSFRTKSHHWNPKMQRPELWSLFNTHINLGESVRVFPLSNWTELDVWNYISKEKIPIVPLYFSKARPVVQINKTLIMVDDDRLPVEGKVVSHKKIRFRTLGCYPLTAAIESEAETVEEIITELLTDQNSERQGRLIDQDQIGSMEDKKINGYF
jgi:sulfate adenylyltransferase subunit 2